MENPNQNLSTNNSASQTKVRVSKRLVKIIVGSLCLIGITFLLIFLFTKSIKRSEQDITTVNNEPVPKNYLTKEIELYPGPKNEQTQKKLEQKVINDQITLIAAKKDGIIKDYDTNPNPTTQQYLARTKQIQDIKNTIEKNANGTSGTLISLWFYDNGHIPPQGMKSAAEFAYKKIKPLYDRVQKKELTIQQAGQLLATDQTLKTIDSAYQVNALAYFSVSPNNPITFWPDFDKKLRNTKPGETTQLYTGVIRDQNGKPTPAFYMFGSVDKNVSDSIYTTYDQWLKIQEEKITISPLGFNGQFFVSKVFADDNGSNQSGGGNEGDNGNGNTCEITPNATGNCGEPPPAPLVPDWNGSVTSQTGVGLGGANISIRCNTGGGGASSDSNGYYHANPISGVNSDCNPITITATYNGTLCRRVPDGSSTINIPNTTATQTNNFVCNIAACGSACSQAGDCSGARDGCTVCTGGSCQHLACGASCTQDANCAGAQNGCTMCISGACHTPQACGTACSQASDCAGARDGCVACTNGSCQHPPPPACGAQCTQDANCTGAQNGCTACRGGVCKNPNACGSSCSQDADCAGARDGCTMCVAGSCKTPRACGTSCTQAADCAGARDGCTACITNAAGQSSCATPPACGTQCSDDRQCAGATGGCSMCIAGACHTVVACGTSCTQAADCAGARDGCTACIENSTGVGSSCKPIPACGTSCTKDSQCNGAANGCNFCSGGKCSAFSENMCSCDGMDFTGPSGNETFFPGDNVNFIAYGVVPGNKWKGSPNAAVSAAQVTSITFYLYQSKLTDPNHSDLIANSAAITPQVVQNDPNKVRYKVTWSRKIPTTVPPGTLYRIQAKVACSAKPGVLGAKTQAVGADNYFSKLYDVVSSLFARGSASVLGTSTTQNQHADTFFPGAKIQEKSCDIIKFFFE